ncbi:unnamed protein product [Closterium sp. Yama58-4]|nr:unnamed protein product [Closterium sp. Yama58-4]
MMVTFANNQDNLEAIIRNRAYVIYPPEGPRPPTAEEVRGLAQRRQQGEGKQAEGQRRGKRVRRGTGRAGKGGEAQREAGWQAAMGGGVQREAEGQLLERAEGGGSHQTPNPGRGEEVGVVWRRSGGSGEEVGFLAQMCQQQAERSRLGGSEGWRGAEAAAGRGEAGWNLEVVKGGGAQRGSRLVGSEGGGGAQTALRRTVDGSRVVGTVDSSSRRIDGTVGLMGEKRALSSMGHLNSPAQLLPTTTQHSSSTPSCHPSMSKPLASLHTARLNSA